MGGFLKEGQSAEELSKERPATSRFDHMTLGSALSIYAEQYTSQKKGARQELSRIRAWQAHPFANRPLASFIPSDWRGYAIERRKTAAASTVRLELAIIRHLFTVASQDWALPLASQFTARTLPKVSNARDRRLSQEEIEAILEATSSPVLKNLLRFALETAMRRSEISHMAWNDVNLQKRTVALKDTKNGERRMVPLSREAVRILESLPGKKGNGRVWAVEPDSITQAFGRAVNRARESYEKSCQENGRVPDPTFLVDIRFHDLRHEATSRLFEKGFNTMTVAAITGHKTLQMLKRYTHLKAEAIAAEMDRLEERHQAPRDFLAER